MASLEDSQDLVSQVIARHQARVAHADSYGVDATFSAPSAEKG